MSETEGGHDLAYFRKLEESARRTELLLKSLRALLNGPQMHRGSVTDPVSISLTKTQAAMLLVLIEDALK